MSSEQLLLVMTAVLAVVALFAAFIAVRAARRIEPALSPETPKLSLRATSSEVVPASPAHSAHGANLGPETQVATIVEGRIIVAPTSRQIVDATMNRPLVRVSVLSHGLAHALRPESRDAIMGLMRREFQSRRRQRKRAARQAARIEHPTPSRSIDQSSAVTEAWLGELPDPSRSAPLNGQVES